MGEPVSTPRPGPVMRAMLWLMPHVTPLHVGGYRLLRGRLLDRATLAGAPVVMLTTTGRRTGRTRTVAVGHLRDGDDVIVPGTGGGRHPLPGWVHNLRAHPDAVVEVGPDRWSATATFLEGPDWQAQWDRLVASYPAYEQARQWAGRDVPLIRLRRT